MRKDGGGHIGWMIGMAVAAGLSTGSALAETPSTASRQGPRLPAIATVQPVILLNALGGPVRSGFGGMINVLPLELLPIHLSAGTRLFPRIAAGRFAGGRDGLLAMPRGMGGRFGRRFSPALLLGVGEGGDRGLSVGADAGIMLGRLDSAPYRLGRVGFGRREIGGQRGSVNPLARATMSYRF